MLNGSGMGSVARLSRPHADAQAEHLATSHMYMRDLLLFDKDTRLELNMQFAPSEGYVIDREQDAFDLYSTYHDVVPYECLTKEQQQKHYHNGSEVNAAAISDNLTRILAQQGMRPDGIPSHEGFSLVLDGDDAHPMPVHVVNVVNTSYWGMDRYGDTVSPVLLGHRFMWRRLPHMGCQVNHVRTSIKFCYGWPWNATELISHPGRVLETGADNHTTADLMFHQVTLKAFQYAGMPNLYVRDRSLRNVVSTMNLPVKNKVLLPLLYHRLSERMETSYAPSEFAGVIVKHPMFKNVRALIFDRGAVVIVGTTSEDQTIEALDFLVPDILECEDSAGTRAALARLGPEIRNLCDVTQKVVTRKRAGVHGQLVPPGGSKKARHK